MGLIEGGWLDLLVLLIVRREACRPLSPFGTANPPDKKDIGGSSDAPRLILV